MKTQQDIAIIIVWFNPTPDQIDNAARLSNKYSNVIVVDNSSTSYKKSKPGEDKYNYYWMNGNRGIASALNHGCSLAVAAQAQYALTLDQDSVFQDQMLDKHIQEATRIFSERKIALIATSSQFTTFSKNSSHVDVNSAICSGSIMRLDTWREISGFKDSLFIDQVDHDYCIRLRIRGYRVVANLGIEMQHVIGNPIEKNIFGFRIYSTNHHWVRRYYQVRNSLYLRKWYPSESKSLSLFLRDMRDLTIGILLLEKDRLRKIMAMLVGILDFYQAKEGGWDTIRPNSKW